MTTRTATLTKLGWIDNGTPSTTKPAARYPYDAVPEPAAESPLRDTIRLEPAFTPWLPAFAPWLPAVEVRISNATLPDGYASLEKTQWVTAEVGAAAVRFFQNTADVLPGEPFIYGSKTGALVAEFQSVNGALTTVISPNSTTLFAVKKDEPEDPIQITVRRGSNRLREDLKNIAQALAGTHGKMGSTSQR
jgi:hypothetical protein